MEYFIFMAVVTAIVSFVFICACLADCNNGFDEKKELRICTIFFVTSPLGGITVPLAIVGGICYVVYLAIRTAWSK